MLARKGLRPAGAPRSDDRNGRRINNEMPPIDHGSTFRFSLRLSGWRILQATGDEVSIRVPAEEIMDTFFPLRSAVRVLKFGLYYGDRAVGHSAARATHAAAESKLRAAPDSSESRLHGDGGADAQFGHRRKYCDVQRGERDPAAADSLGKSGPTCSSSRGESKSGRR